VTEYNYPHFDGYIESGGEVAEFAAFRQMLHPLETAPDATLTLLDGGESVRLSEIWHERGVVLEFGSFT
jgi:hypothetical protein